MDAITGRHLWAERYDRTIEECFRLHDEVVRSVVATLEHRVADNEVERGERKSPQRWAAYDYVLQARARLARYDNDYLVAEAFLRQAIALEPTLSEAYSLLALALLRKLWMEGDGTQLEEALSLARRSVALDEKESSSHYAMASVLLFMREYERAGSTMIVPSI